LWPRPIAVGAALFCQDNIGPRDYTAPASEARTGTSTRETPSINKEP